MASKKFQFSWKTILLPVLGLLAFFLYLYIFNVDIPKIIAMAQRTDLYIYVLAAVTIVLDTFFFALSWHFLLNFLSVKISVLKSFLYVWFGIFMDLIIPAESISGEITRIYLVTKEHNGVTGKVVASLVAHRLIGMGINVLSLFLGAITLLIERHLHQTILNLITFLAVATIILLALLLFLCVKERWTMKIVDITIGFLERISRGHWKLQKFRGDILEAAKTFHSSIKEFGHAPKTLAKASFSSVVAWIFSFTAAYLVFLSIGYTEIHWSAVIVTCSIVVVVKSIPLGVPFEVGLPEITMSTLYILLGVPPDVSATATILTRLLTVWFRFFIGFAVQQWLGIKSTVMNLQDLMRKKNGEA